MPSTTQTEQLLGILGSTKTGARVKEAEGWSGDFVPKEEAVGWGREKGSFSWC